MDGIGRVQNEERGEEDGDPERNQQNHGFVHKDPYGVCFAVSSLSMVLTTGSQLLRILLAAVIKTKIAVL